MLTSNVISLILSLLLFIFTFHTWILNIFGCLHTRMAKDVWVQRKSEHAQVPKEVEMTSKWCIIYQTIELFTFHFYFYVIYKHQHFFFWLCCWGHYISKAFFWSSSLWCVGSFICMVQSQPLILCDSDLVSSDCTSLGEINCGLGVDFKPFSSPPVPIPLECSKEVPIWHPNLASCFLMNATRMSISLSRCANCVCPSFHHVNMLVET